ncbi:related to Branchpoint-bridging protein [Cephalotrichum gorgonifer]|uniref:Branchpoint-bridging protein n=1 Tax=Cephalotrichum gorgonifer TaxID=2041049 RepID=A0AAE8MRC0_9PEZI|nr:related to Branchpoint-bridging protein [Cephalotrichum gorgonifer]
MSWRNQGVTGSNSLPLGKTRRFQDSDGAPQSDAAPSRFDGGDRDLKRGRSPERRTEAEVDGPKRRKKRNRWGDASDNKAAGLMGLPTAIVANMTSEQLEAYALHLRIEEISQKLRIDDVVPADGDRSPSPAPQYDNQGRRINTREYRYRKKLEDERHKLIEKAMKTIPNYHPPQDYRRPTKTQEKVYVPVNDYPEINFIGLLIGPRGNTLKKMEQDSGAKIAIRGKGSVKEGKGKSDAAHSSNQEEDLHCLIMAESEEKINKAKKLIHNVIETAASIPEGQNELKRNQLRELAALNGTLRDDENQACQNCGRIGHRKYDCPDKPNFTASIICRVCGNAGHMARDCPDRQRGASWRNDGPGRGAGGGGGDAVDREYESSAGVLPLGLRPALAWRMALPRMVPSPGSVARRPAQAKLPLRPVAPRPGVPGARMAILAKVAVLVVMAAVVGRLPGHATEEIVIVPDVMSITATATAANTATTVIAIATMVTAKDVTATGETAATGATVATGVMVATGAMATDATVMDPPLTEVLLVLLPALPPGAKHPAPSPATPASRPTALTVPPRAWPVATAVCHLHPPLRLEVPLPHHLLLAVHHPVFRLG